MHLLVLLMLEIGVRQVLVVLRPLGPVAADGYTSEAVAFVSLS